MLASSQSLSPDYLSVTPFCFQDFGSFSLSLFGILYQVDSLSLRLLFGLVGIYPVPLPAEHFSAFFILFRLLCLGWPFCRLEVCGSSLLWRLLPVGGAVCLNHLQVPSHSVSWVCHESAVSAVPGVSSGELISGCNPPGRCQMSRIPGRFG